MNRCTRCVIPDTRPDTHFDDGVCSACRSYAIRPEIDWEVRKQELLRLLDRYDGRCIVPSSGGKDSHYQVLTLLEMGADVTVVTASTCHLTPIGRHNIDNLARYARTLEVTPNRTVRAKLNRLGLELVGDISWPEHASIFSTPFRMARALGINLLFYGESPQNQYGGPPGSEAAREMTRRWVTEFGGFLGLRPSDFVGMEGIKTPDMVDYSLLADMEGIEAHFLGQYLPWDSEYNAEVAAEAGMQQILPTNANWWKAENLDNAQTGIHDFFGWLKYGYGRMAAQISVDIRKGKVGRNEALAMVKAWDGAFPRHYAGVEIERVLYNIGMTIPQFIECANKYMNRSLFVQDRLDWGRHLTLKEFA